MSEEKFEWTDNDVIDFHKKYMGSESHNIYNYLKQFKQSKLNSNKDWEIYESYTNTTYPPTEVIKSVRRLSDGEIFTKGDKVYYYSNPKQVWVIDNFYIGENNKCLARSKNDEIVEVVDDTLKKANKQSLFKTEDGKEIFEGDDCWMLSEGAWLINLIKNVPQKPFTGINNHFKYFSTEQAAKDYIIWNKPELSLNDIVGASVNVDSSSDILCYVYTDKLKQLVEKKINYKS